MTPASAPKSTGDVMTDIMGNVGNLLRDEVDLARAEVSGSLGKAVVSIEVMALSLVIAVAGLNLLAAALVAFAIEAGLTPQWATVAVGAGLLLLALVVFRSAKSSFNQIGFMPTRAARSVRRDAAAFKEAKNDK